jgi:hypothetical protein
MLIWSENWIIHIFMNIVFWIERKKRGVFELHPKSWTPPTERGALHFRRLYSINEQQSEYIIISVKELQTSKGS